MKFKSALSKSAGILLVMILMMTVIYAQPVQADEDSPVVVTSFTILEDIVDRVAGDMVDSRVLAPAGAEVHEWELIPENFVDLEEADLFLYNGFNLEVWLDQALNTLDDGAAYKAVGENVEADTIPIQLGDFEGDPDPHLWMDPLIYIEYVEAVSEKLGEVDPDNALEYEINSARYISEIWDLHADLSQDLAQIPSDSRVLVTSEAAFLYFADRYDFEHQGIWGSNAEEEGTPDQIARTVDLVQDRNPGALFYESTISDRHVRSVAGDTDSEVYGPLYVDSTAEPGEPADNYIDMMKINKDIILEAMDN